MFSKVKQCAAGIFACIIAITSVLPASAQTYPLVGTYTGNTSRNASAYCESLQPEVVTVATQAEAMIYSLFLPITPGGEKAPNCPNLIAGSQFLLDASGGAVQELIHLGNNPETWAVTDIETNTIFDQSVISPTISLDRWNEIVEQNAPGANQIAIGIWALPEPLMGGGDNPVNWRLYLETERSIRLEEIRYPDVMLDENTKVSDIPVPFSGIPLKIVCPQIAGKAYYAKWVGTMPPTSGVMIEVEHYANQLPSICPRAALFNYVEFQDVWRLVPAKVKKEVDDYIEQDRPIWKRNAWVMPEGTMTPEVAAATFTAGAAIGGASFVYMSLKGTGGAGAGGYLLMFIANPSDPRMTK